MLTKRSNRANRYVAMLLLGTSALLVIALTPGPVKAASLDTVGTGSVPDVRFQQAPNGIAGMSADGRTVLFKVTNDAINNGTAQPMLWDGRTATLITMPSPGAPMAVSGLSADGTAIVGSVQQGITHAWIWKSGQWIDLGSLDPAQPSYGNGISGDGSVATGSSNDASGNPHAFFWNSGGMSDITPFGATNSYGFRVSRDGSTIIGGYDNNAGPVYAFRWQTGSSVDLGNLGGDGTWATLVNFDGSVVAGYSTTASNGLGESHSFRWTQGNGIADLNIAGQDNSTPNAMDRLGETIVGSYRDLSGTHAYRWSVATGMVALDQTGRFSEALGVNSDGTVTVGRVEVTPGTYSGMRWQQGQAGVTVDDWLRSLGVQLSSDITASAQVISDDGKTIAGHLRASNQFYLARANGSQTGIISLNSFLPTVGNTASAPMAQMQAFGSTVMSGAQGMPMRNLLAPGQRAIWGTIDGGYDRNGGGEGLLGVGDFGIGVGLEGGSTLRLSGGAMGGHGNLSTGGDFSSAGFYVAPEASVALGGNIYLTVGGFAGGGSLHTNRGYLNGTAMDYSAGDTSFASYGVKARLDWKDAMTIGDGAVTPYFALSHNGTTINGYSENGGSFPVSYDTASSGATVARLGADFVYPLSDTVRLLARAEADYRFEATTPGTTATIAGIGSFALPDQSNRQFWVRGGLGLEADIGSGTASAMINATTEGGDADFWVRTSWMQKF